MAYSPLGSTGGPLFTAEPVVTVAAKHGVAPAKVLLSYHSAFPLYPLATPESKIEEVLT
jgi:diketogulonate reductase-like aldo/keto reductase